ncbi:electron transfer flavoprotein-ubiquinone oxidoreductase [Pseudosulfitobacter pseudonitzschiae]|uniref:electron transfer flavoprotein-ubiquinone oxidoreductase n=1 Tax=Pseudosulfitobacter pseudonitzschiae TaxID=1402135 RepID=UPI001AF8EB2C|nr:electron transfer flavoprotein-ubiquinone oxidoreductase [Pseudosulfitobacter pseudonitzschiae]MBM1814169.1 electron transfer flavoprotein-ubiquinone oxidoreductase [Pseudosulfitobacter pseudonitzschiae]MBM1831162.1 electron transfer flavoprotein-ubiquinone oxidoreductase [Pseudosulfitobacter pseudonitzschiae]MBM1836029.1 electron transfer flavoprotein-ubiquinone oxidoreductase [Pseudosulfitobacter pseudonitzschiae]MBM1840875.1 electron transfer flavoprotein-ubiquinone oxidoreductase [Pseudo
MADTEREAMEYDVVIVGAGPAGLSAAIRLKQLDADLNVVVLEKGSEVGAHILSGAVLDPRGLDALIPDWKEKGAPVTIPVKEDNFYMLGEAGQVRIPNFPMPPLMNNHGNYIVSMGNVCRWMAEQAEALGVEVFPGMACSELVYGENGEVKGVVAGEFGISADGTKGDSYEPGMELHGKYVFLGEGVRGSLSKEVIAKYDLSAGKEPQKFGLGMKEIWEIDPAKHKEGTVTHTMGWPLGSKAGGGSFIYHLDNNQVYVGFVVHLGYKNPYVFPYMEFQQFKHHPMVAELLKGGKRVAYGARAITEGGYQSMPKMVAPGVALLGCSVGMVNVPRIKGNHNAMLSGKAAAEAAFEAIKADRSGDELTAYEDEVRNGAIGKDLKKVRNVKPLWSKYGLTASLALGGFDMWCNTLGFSLLGTLGHGKSDADATEPAEKHKEISYPKPDGKLSFDRLTNVAFSFTNHEESQPAHLKLKDPSIPVERNLPVYAGPSARYCPAGVYEFVTEDGKDPRFVINFQNCVHCKTCDIKDPSQNINWTTPQGGDGPNYPNM